MIKQHDIIKIVVLFTLYNILNILFLPPFQISTFIFIYLIPLFYIILNYKFNKIILISFVFTRTLFWMLELNFIFSIFYVPVSIIYIIMNVFLDFIMLILVYYIKNRRLNFKIIYYAMFFILIELLRTHIRIFIPLVSPVYGIKDYFGLNKLLYFGGIGAVNYIIILLNISAAFFLLSKKKRYLVFLLVLIFGIFISNYIKINTSKKAPLKVGIVNTDIISGWKSDLKNKDFITERIFKKIDNLTDVPEILVFPESCFLSFLDEDTTILKKFKKYYIKGLNLIIVGSKIKEDNKTYNSAFFYNLIEDDISVIHKNIPIPFIENKMIFNNNKLNKIVSRIFKGPNISKGYNIPQYVYKKNGIHINIFPVICWEMIYNDYINKVIYKNDSNIIMNLANENLIKTNVAEKHLINLGQITAIQTKIPVIKSTNMGVGYLFCDNKRYVSKPATMETYTDEIEIYEYKNNFIFAFIRTVSMEIIVVIALCLMVIDGIIQRIKIVNKS